MSQDEDYDEYEHIKSELKTLTQEELVQEVITRIKDQRQMLIDNWQDTANMRRQNSEYRQAIHNCELTLDKASNKLDKMFGQIRYWKYSFMALLFLLVLMLGVSCFV